MGRRGDGAKEEAAMRFAGVSSPHRPIAVSSPSLAASPFPALGMTDPRSEQEAVASGQWSVVSRTTFSVSEEVASATRPRRNSSEA
jgi:hypothetical protein